ncbi:MAG TPA: ferrous iron transport protein A [Clostridiales bacterium]|nr:MAG: iron transporter FeoA [Clostridiales bacterium GWD2_32_19]HCC08220.1 ferrous iron transport protein A [Clostridiales bacterium]
MNKHLMYLNQLKTGQNAIIKQLVCEGNTRRRMMDLGLIPDTKIEALQKSPSGDPTAYYIRGAVIALRSEEASKIIIKARD